MICKTAKGTDNITTLYKRKSCLSLVSKNQSKTSKHVFENMADL